MHRVCLFGGVLPLTLAGFLQPQTARGPRDTAAEYQRLVSQHRSEIESRKARVLRELEAPPADVAWAKEWAGVYANSDGFVSSTYDLAPSAGFAYIHKTDTGAFWGNAGDVLGTVPGGIRVKLLIDPAQEWDGACSDVFYFTSRGEERYLVPAAQLLQFCNWCNARSGWTREDSFTPMVRQGGKRKAGDSAVNVPDEFRRYILSGPLSAKVTAVVQLDAHGGALSGTARLDRGDADGVYTGLQLGFVGNSGSQWLKVTQTEEHAATATFAFSASVFGKAEPPQIGQVVKTVLAPR